MVKLELRRLRELSALVNFGGNRWKSAAMGIHAVCPIYLLLECSIGCVVLRHGETVESSTLPENGNNPISWLTQNEVGNKEEQPITLQCVLGNNTERVRNNGGVDRSGEVCSASSHT